MSPNEYQSGDSCSVIVEQYMSRSVVVVNDCDSVRVALQKFGEEKISALPVINSSGAFVGIVTVGDLLRSVTTTEQALESKYPHFDDCLWAVDLIQRRLGSDPVSTVMTEVVATISPEDTMKSAAEKMLDFQVHHLPVVMSDGELVGLLSTTDFVRWARAQ